MRRGGEKNGDNRRAVSAGGGGLRGVHDGEQAVKAKGGQRHNRRRPHGMIYAAANKRLFLHTRIGIALLNTLAYNNNCRLPEQEAWIEIAALRIEYHSISYPTHAILHMETSNHLTRRTRQSPPGIFVPQIRCPPAYGGEIPRVWRRNSAFQKGWWTWLD